MKYYDLDANGRPRAAFKRTQKGVELQQKVSRGTISEDDLKNWPE